MKKIILFLFLSFCFISSCKAGIIASQVKISSSNISICVDGESYSIKKMGGPGSNLYFLNPNKNYNYKFADYYDLAWEDSPFDKDIAEYVSYFFKHGLDSYYYETTVKKLWEKIYPEHTINFCSPSAQLTDIMIKTEDMMENVSSGPDFINEPQFLDPGEEQLYNFSYINYFEIVESSGLDTTIEDDLITVKANNPGAYELVLKRKPNTSESAAKLYTDETNYLITNGTFPDKEYKATFYVGYKKFSFKATDEQGNSLSESSFTIFKDGEKYLDIKTREDGSYEEFLPIGEYYITNLEKTYKEYFFIEEDFSLNTIVKKNNDSKNNLLSKPYSSFAENLQSVTLDTVQDVLDDFSSNQNIDKEISVVFPDTLWHI